MSTYLGQNFLKDSKIISFIVAKIADLYHDLDCEAIVEIGPGKGAITKKIHTLSDNFIVVERDEKMVPYIEALSSTISIIHEDVLKVDFTDVLRDKGINPKKTLVVGNLPYYITSPIVRQFFGQAKQAYAGGFFMMQKEVGDKIKADAPKKSYLWRLVNFAHVVSYSKTVPAKAFSPAPKVQSCLLAFAPKAEAASTSEDFEKLLELLDGISPYKRKTMGKIRKMLEKKGKTLKALPDSIASKRIEELGWEDMLTLL